MKYNVLINCDNMITKKYLESLNLIKINDICGKESKIERRTGRQFLLLKKFLKDNKNIEIGICEDNYRTNDDQIRIFNQFESQYGKNYAERYVAKPGASEHHTGLAIDLNLNIDGKWCQTNEELLKQVSTFKIIHKYLHNYGFILRYPIGKEKITGFSYEPWHIRYVGIKLAKYLYLNNLTLEEYFAVNNSEDMSIKIEVNS